MPCGAILKCKLYIGVSVGCRNVNTISIVVVSINAVVHVIFGAGDEWA